MVSNKNLHDIPVPPADMILNLIRMVPNTANEYLAFYDAYIRKAAIEPIYTVDGCCCGTCLNEDLQQEIEFALVRGLSPLRRKIISYLSGEYMLILVSPDDLFE